MKSVFQCGLNILNGHLLLDLRLVIFRVRVGIDKIMNIIVIHIRSIAYDCDNSLVVQVCLLGIHRNRKETYNR